MRRTPRFPLSSQRGVGSLIVVMVLLFIVAMVAAYTSRNLIFEQRTSANQYRSTQALETAEAGIEWAIAMLSQGRIGADCKPSTNPADSSFRQRYLSFDGNGNIGALVPYAGGIGHPTCMLNGGDWACSCPPPGTAPTVPALTGSDIHPAFRVRFNPVTTTPGLVRIEVNGCTTLLEDCLKFDSGTGTANEGRARVYSILGLASALATPPTAALTAGGDVALQGTFYNTNPNNGIVIHARGTIGTTGTTLVGPAGSPNAVTVESDTALPDSAEGMATSTFNMYPRVYKAQPAAIVLNGGAATTASLATLVSLNPGRPLWIEGDLNLASAGTIGTPADPVLIYVTGNVTLTDSGLVVNGLIFGSAADWTLEGAGTVNGAVIAAGKVSGTGTVTVVHDAAALDTLRWTTGSFVRVPGGWSDFAPTP